MDIQKPHKLEILPHRVGVEVHPSPTPSHEQSDEYLLYALAHGATGALEPLYRRHSGLLFSLTYRMVGNHAIAEDLVQETFLAVWQHAGSYSPASGTVRGWLASLMRYHTIDYLRKLRRRVCYKEVLWEEVERGNEAMLPDVWEEVWRNEQGLLIREALLQLSAEQRVVITLAYFHGWTHMEIAQRCELPVGTVKSRLRLGLLHLKQTLGQLYEDELPSSGNTQRRQVRLQEAAEAAEVVVQKTENGCPSGYEVYRNGTCKSFGYTQWEQLLEQIDAFEFHGAGASFTARKERRFNGQFCWYAYQWNGKCKKKLYLGKSSELTLARVEEMAKKLEGR